MNEGSANVGGVSATGIAAALAGFSTLALLARLRKAGVKSGRTEVTDFSVPENVAKLKDRLGITLDSKAYVDLLRQFISEAVHVQNYPPELIPQEDRIVAHILETLGPYTEEKGGPLKIEVVTYEPGRGNVIITYPGTDTQAPNIGLIGSHLDVVPAYAEAWERDPFKLSVEGDKLYGRGTTDCLGHVALLTCFFRELGIKKPALKSGVVAVFIASEESIDKPGVGIDGLVEHGKLENLKSGVCLWIDASDSEPCMGTAGAIPWHLKAVGKRFHSGFPHKTVNPIELVSEALAYIQKRFYEDFPEREEERRYKFATGSSFKPTQIKCADGSFNQIPPHATVSGDIRLTPFYDASDVVRKVRQYVDELNNEKHASLPTRGPYSKYDVPDLNLTGKLELNIGDGCLEGIACKIDSKAFHVLCHSLKTVRGFVKPYSICGSLPLVREMQESGFDLQITGFGLSSVYHAENEYCKLSDMENACKIVSLFVSGMDEMLN